MRLPRETGKEMLHVLMQHGMVIQVVSEEFQFLLVGQVPVDDEVGDFNERGLRSQLFDGDSTVAEYSFFAIEKGDFAFAGSGVPITRIHRNVTGLRSQLSDVDGFFIF